MHPDRLSLLLTTALLLAGCSAPNEPETGPLAGPWKRHVIDASSEGADGVRLIDVNGDGLLDITTGWEEGGVIRVYLNPGPAEAREPWPAATVGEVKSPEDAVFVDLDGDGAIDVVSSCEGRERSLYVHWAPKEPVAYLDAAAWRTEPIAAARNAMQWMFTLPMQVDGTLGIDLVSGAKGEGAQIGWFEAPARPRDLKAWRYHPIYEAGWIMSIVGLDMDGDGDLDLLVSDRKGPRPGALWLENPGPGEAQKKPWPVHRIGGTGREVMFLDPVDLDGDGLLDVLTAAKTREILFHRRKSADGRQWEEFSIPIPDSAGTAKAVRAGDINLDGKLDLVFSCEHAQAPKSGVMWLSYEGSVTGGQWRAHDVSGPEGVKYDLIELIDLDGDGDLDILTCEETTGLGVIWYENPTRRPAPASR